MKKALLLLTVLVGIVFGASAQCTADSTHFSSSHRIYPDSLPCIVVSHAFSGTVSIQIPDSLDANNFVSAVPSGMIKATIDSVRIDSITGYPTGITSASSPALGTWLHPLNIACAIFSGTTTDSAGTYNLHIYGTGCGHFTAPTLLGGGTYDSCLQAFPFSRIYPYSLKVCYPAGISQVADGLTLSIYPNPNQGNFSVTISSASHISGSMSVLDQLGRTINTQNIDVTGTKQIALNLGNISAGAYLLTINTENGKSVKQFIVK